MADDAELLRRFVTAGERLAVVQFQDREGAKRSVWLRLRAIASAGREVWRVVVREAAMSGFDAMLKGPLS